MIFLSPVSRINVRKNTPVLGAVGTRTNLRLQLGLPKSQSRSGGTTTWGFLLRQMEKLAPEDLSKIGIDLAQAKKALQNKKVDLDTRILIREKKAGTKNTLEILKRRELREMIDVPPLELETAWRPLGEVLHEARANEVISDQENWLANQLLWHQGYRSRENLIQLLKEKDQRPIEETIDLTIAFLRSRHPEGNLKKTVADLIDLLPQLFGNGFRSQVNFSREVLDQIFPDHQDQAMDMFYGQLMLDKSANPDFILFTLRTLFAGSLYPWGHFLGKIVSSSCQDTPEFAWLAVISSSISRLLQTSGMDLSPFQCGQAALAACNIVTKNTKERSFLLQAIAAELFTEEKKQQEFLGMQKKTLEEIEIDIEKIRNPNSKSLLPTRSRKTQSLAPKTAKAIFWRTNLRRQFKVALAHVPRETTSVRKILELANTPKTRTLIELLPIKILDQEIYVREKVLSNWRTAVKILRRASLRKLLGLLPLDLPVYQARLAAVLEQANDRDARFVHQCLVEGISEIPKDIDAIAAAEDWSPKLKGLMLARYYWAICQKGEKPDPVESGMDLGLRLSKNLRDKTQQAAEITAEVAKELFDTSKQYITRVPHYVEFITAALASLPITSERGRALFLWQVERKITKTKGTIIGAVIKYMYKGKENLPERDLQLEFVGTLFKQKRFAPATCARVAVNIAKVLFRKRGQALAFVSEIGDRLYKEKKQDLSAFAAKAEEKLGCSPGEMLFESVFSELEGTSIGLQVIQTADQLRNLNLVPFAAARITFRIACRLFDPKTEMSHVRLFGKQVGIDVYEKDPEGDIVFYDAYQGLIEGIMGEG